MVVEKPRNHIPRNVMSARVIYSFTVDGPGRTFHTWPSLSDSLEDQSVGDVTKTEKCQKCTCPLVGIQTFNSRTVSKGGGSFSKENSSSRRFFYVGMTRVRSLPRENLKICVI